MIGVLYYDRNGILIRIFVGILSKMPGFFHKNPATTAEIAVIPIVIHNSFWFW